MAVLSGKTAALQVLSAPTIQDTLRNWTINVGGNVTAYVASNSDGMTGQVDGNDDWTGSAAFYGSVPKVLPGEAANIKAYTGTDSWAGDAIVDSITVNVDVEAGGIIDGTINFSGNGALTPGTATAVTDSSTPNPPSVIGLKIAWGDPTPADISIARYTFTINSANLAYVDTDAAGITKRVAGILSATGSWELYESETDALPTKGTANILRHYVTASTFWEMQWAMVTGITSNADVEGGSIVRPVVNWAFSGFKGGSKGQILKPDTNAFWD